MFPHFLPIYSRRWSRGAHLPLPTIPHFPELTRLPRIDTDEFPVPVEPDRELEDSRKISLTLLMAFLTIHEVSASYALGAATLALLVYTINLHVVVNARFLWGSSVLSKLLHSVPLLGVFSMAVLKLVILVRSPAIVSAILLASASPPLVIAICFVRRYAGRMFMWDVASVLPANTIVYMLVHTSQR